MHKVKVTRVAAITEVDPRAVVNHKQARELLTAVSYVGSRDRARGRHLVAFFATMIGSTTYSRVWEEARLLALTPAQVASPLAGRPYDLRHAALTTWLNAGIPPAEVSKRAGNTIEVLLRRYAGCLDKQADAINRRIEQAMTADISPELEMEP